MLRKFLEDKGIEKHYDKLVQLRDLTLEYNKNVNLTAIREPSDFDKKNIIDSLLPISEFDFDNKKIIDVGTGGGFPGLVLAIVFPNSKFTLLDSNNKKTTWIKYAINELDINNVEVIEGRIEETSFKDKFDMIISRAVAPLNVLIEITSHTIDNGGEMILYKGANVLEETPDNWWAIKKLGLKYIDIKEIELDNETTRTFVHIRKIEDKEIVKRHYSQIKKKPIY